MSVELHRPVSLNHIPDPGLDMLVEASSEECAALAVRMGLPAVRALRCEFHLSRLSQTIIVARGSLNARVVQTCIISAEDFEADVEEAFTVRFVPLGTENDDPDPDADDEIPYEHGMLNLGEAAAEQLALALDPYPRAPGAALPEIEDEGDSHPFAALRQLRGTE